MSGRLPDGAAPDAPADRPTRGRTARGRLAALDAWVLHAERALLERSDGPFAGAAFVDVGVGETPWTTIETAEALAAAGLRVPVIGVERDPDRVANAQPLVTAARAGGADVTVVLGDFDLAVPAPIRVLRVMNILRAWPPAGIPAVHARLGARLPDGALALEGTCNPEGGVLTCHLLRRVDGALRREGLLFHTDFTQGFAPPLFRDRLPRDLRRVGPGTQLHAFFAAWTAAWAEVRGGPPAESFVRSVAGLALRLPGIDLDPWLAARGYLVWRPPGGVAPAAAQPMR